MKTQFDLQFHADGSGLQPTGLAPNIPARHRAIYRFLELRGAQGATGIEIRNHLESLGMGTADVARDISDLCRRFGVPRERIICTYVAQSTAGSSINKWRLTK